MRNVALTGSLGLGILAIIVALVVGIAALGALITQFVWNSVIADLCSGPSVTLLQAFLVNIGLSLVGSFFRHS